MLPESVYNHLRLTLKADEGYKRHPYRDLKGQLTIGVGHNLEAKGLTDAQIELILSDDIEDAIESLASYPWYSKVDPARQSALINMMFQLGAARFAEFRSTIALLAKGEYAAAAEVALDSQWAQQTPSRAYRVARLLRTGELA